MLFNYTLDPESLALARSMVTGNVRELSEKTYFLFGVSGLAHALSASGFHLISAIILMKLVKAPIHKALTNLKIFSPDAIYYTDRILILVVVVAFTLASGRASPTVRAASALLLYLTLASFGLKPKLGVVFAFAALIALSFGLGSYLSLALSLTAIASFAWSLKFIPKSAPRWHYVLAFPLAPWIATQPIIIWNFHTLSIGAPLVNACLGPWLSIPVLIPGITALFLKYSPFRFLESIAWDLSAASLSSMLRLLEAISNSMTLSLWVPRFEWLLGTILLSSTWFIVRDLRKKILALILAGLIIQQLTTLIDATPRATILDVGQGDSIALRTPGHEPFLIDFGKSGQAPYPAKSAFNLASLGKGKISGVLLTHPDADHAGGLESVLLRFSLSPGSFLWVRRSHFHFRGMDKVLRSAELFRIPIRLLEDDESPYPGLVCRSIPVSVPKTTNSSSPLCLFNLGGDQKLLLTGDLGEKEEQWFLAHSDSGFLKASHLKLGHHGSKSSSSPEFLDEVGARVAIVSAGRKNPYKHPHPDVIQRLEKRAIQIRSTINEGNIALP